MYKRQLVDVIQARNMHCFINTVVEDSVMIYYGDFKNPVESDIYNNLRSSPYRNYIKEELPDRYGAVYLMLIDETEKIESLYEELERLGYTKEFKVLKYDSDDYPGYTYIKIYNKKAIKENMIKYVQSLTDAKSTLVFEKDNEVFQNYISKNDPNEVVKKLRKIYRPYFWHKY